MDGLNLPGATSLIEDLDSRVLVVLRDGKTFCGLLTSLDQYSNIVLEKAVERNFVGNLMTEIPVGCVTVRSDNIVLVGRLDLEKEANSGPRLVSEEEFEAELDRLEASGEEVKSVTDKAFWNFDN
mmetsp:Transcript_23642/g.43922  ORF Transcript_23642/g.43922 Transcript_23642/m.43922 type:complete len:125 (+) Transcript_23642:47-421(+)